MTIKVRCSCGKEFQVDPRYAGKKATCRRCGHELMLLGMPKARGSVDHQIDDWLEGSFDERLFRALQGKRLGEIRVLLRDGADPNGDPGPDRPGLLLLAVQTERLDIVRALLEAGANPNGGDEDDPSRLVRDVPLREAVKRGSLEMAKALIEAGANPSLGSPMVLAAKNRRLDLAGLLIDAGANLEDKRLLRSAFDVEDTTMFEFLLDTGIKPVKSELSKMLILAGAAGNVPLVKLLLSLGADPDATDARGTCVLYAAASNGMSEVVRLVLRAGADPNRKCPGVETTLLEYAERIAHERIIELLRGAGAS